MKLGFAKVNITPPLGTELAGYAGYRLSAGVHDPLYCKAVFLEQEGVRYALIALDLLCVDEALYYRIAQVLEPLGIAKQRLIVSAIHTHAAPRGVIPGEGPLAQVNSPSNPNNSAFHGYIQTVIHAAYAACEQAVMNLEPFLIRAAQGELPPVGSERHTGDVPKGNLTVIQCRTESGKLLTVYNFPCHPTVMSAANLLVSADFVGTIEERLGGEMAVFLNGAGGDVSTRFTRRESTFAECARMGSLAAEQIKAVIETVPYKHPEPVRGIHAVVTLRARRVEKPEQAQKQYDELFARWKAAQESGADASTLRMLKSYVEGAGVNLQFAQTMGDITQLHLPVTVFRLFGLNFVTVPGELFSALQPEGLAVIGYANGYYRYFGGEEAYEAGHYEALAAIIARGEGERLVNEILKLQKRLNAM